MDTKPEEQCELILAHFGVKKQIFKSIEEFIELYGALLSGEKKAILEELADVWIMLNQVDSIINLTLAQYDISNSDLIAVIDQKIKRTRERIESGYYDRPRCSVIAARND